MGPTSHQSGGVEAIQLSDNTYLFGTEATLICSGRVARSGGKAKGSTPTGPRRLRGSSRIIVAVRKRRGAKPRAAADMQYADTQLEFIGNLNTPGFEGPVNRTMLPLFISVLLRSCKDGPSNLLSRLVVIE